ncbi:glutamine synthetase [Firmicutes bacterium AM41-11]|nr:glutamine synthetase [Firmicutes bacterium AM41-11]
MLTQKEVMEYVEEENVKFIRLAFFDVKGHQKNISIQPSELLRAFSTGISFDASAIEGFNDEAHSDLFLVPEPRTLSILPWRSFDGSVVRMYCDIYNPDGTLYKNDTRYLLKQALEQAKKAQIEIRCGNEYEFYLFQLDEKGKATKTPLDQAGYMDIAPFDQGEDVRRQICHYMMEMGMEPEASHHEQGPGQNEIDFRYNNPLLAAEDGATLRWVIKTVAQANGLVANFMPKPLKEEAGNGFHINMSTNSHMDEFMAGILNHIKEITLFLNPTENSYDRLGEDKAPKYVSWGYNNRSTLIRIPAGNKRLELRSPDCLANTFLAYTLLIYAGLDGIEKHMTCMEPTSLNLFKETGKFDVLPQSLKEAKKLAKNSDFVKKYVPENILKAYL